MNKKDNKIICIDICNGKTHDFKLYKDSKVKTKPSTKITADSGYQGISKIHLKSSLPKKNTKKKKLTKEEKATNRGIARERIAIEHVNASVKRFHIVADKYRNRRKRFGLRFNLIAGIYNFEIDN